MLGLTQVHEYARQATSQAPFDFYYETSLTKLQTSLELMI